MPVHRIDEVDGNVFGVSDDEYNNDIQDSDEAGEKSDESWIYIIIRDWNVIAFIFQLWIDSSIDIQWIAQK